MCLELLQSMSQSTARHFIFSFTYSLFLIGLFVVGGGGVLLMANGYEINWQTRTISQTGVVVLAGQAPPNTIALDGTTVGNRLPITLRGITTGSHTIQITADKYQLWRLSARIEAGQAIIRDQIELWLTTPTQVVTQSPPTLDAPLVDPTLAIDGLELYQLQNGQRQLVTRFSQTPLAAYRSNDRAHIFVQLGRDVYVTELTGENTSKLVSLTDATPTPMLTQNNDSQLIVKNGSEVQTWQIR